MMIYWQRLPVGLPFRILLRQKCRRLHKLAFLLEVTVRAGLDSLIEILRFANPPKRWIDAYIGGLNDRQQAFVKGPEESNRRPIKPTNRNRNRRTKPHCSTTGD